MSRAIRRTVRLSSLLAATLVPLVALGTALLAQQAIPDPTAPTPSGGPAAPGPGSGARQAEPADEPAKTESAEQVEQRGKNDKSDKKPRRLRRKEIEAEAAKLPEKYQQFLLEVEFLISDEELRAFFELAKDYQRDAFIERFWRIRDPYPRSPNNEFRDSWYERLSFAREEFGDLREDRSRMLLLNGPPHGRIEFRCSGVHPMEIWFYDGSDRIAYEFFLVFYKKWGGQRFYLWRPSDGISELADFGAAGSGGQNLWQDIYSCRDGDLVLGVLRRLSHPSMSMDYEMLLGNIERPKENPSSEWLTTFSSYSTDLPEDAPTFPATLEIDYPQRYQGRTVVKATVSVPKAQVGTSELAGYQGFNFFLVGEILRDGKLFEQFRYKFDFPSESVNGEQIPIVFQRRLRPGSYDLLIRLEDINSQSYFFERRTLGVPRIETDIGSLPEDPETRRILEEAAIAIGTDIPTLQIVEPHGTMQTGMVRFDTLITGQGIAEVRFALDDRVVMQKRRPPYSVELDLGTVPRIHELRVSAHDEHGTELASDRLTLNAGQHQFAVQILEPRAGVDYSDLVDAEAAVLTPEGRPVERLEFYYNETLVATLYQPPFVQRIDIPPGNQLGYVRAVAYLPDQNSTEDLVYVNAPDYLENVDIEYVELYATVLDRQGKPLLGLERDQFTVFEDGAQQEILRFEKVENLPIHGQVMIDVSASMEGNVDAVQQAALRFFQEAITPKDRASLVTFNDHPYLAVKFTNEVDVLAGGLAGLKAERGTSLYDAVIFGLYYMNGLKGQKTMLILSDGKDESSRFTFDHTLEYARRAGVAIYTIGLGIGGKDSGQAKKVLTQLADETGGRAFFIKEVGELAAIYQLIQQELRSRYLITYQSTNSVRGDQFRTVELRTSLSGASAKTMRGYYP